MAFLTAPMKTFKNTPFSFSSPLLLSFVVSLCVLLSASGCAKLESIFDFRGNEEVNVQQPVDDLINSGMDDYNLGKYFTALEYFNEILNKYPFSPQAVLAELKAADCNYYLEKYIEALMLYREFEERHPTNEAIPYVMYQKGMSYYMQIDSIDRDTSGATQAIDQFSLLLRAFPTSPYTGDAQARIKAAREFLVNHEYLVVRFYLRTEKYSEAENRLKYIIATYPDAKITVKARALLAELEAGTPPTSGLSSWFPEFKLPNWATFK